ncbi:hypothetical protein Tco_0331771 [Tanacetum coccineum]
MDKLLSKYIGIYIEQLRQGGLRIPFSTFFFVVIKHFKVFYKLCKQGHQFSFENKTGGRSKKCFKEVTSSMKGWKKKFFLIDRRAISKAMPCRHTDTDVRDDFLTNYNEGDVERLVEHVVPLRPPPHHLLYVCGLTTACRHPKLSYSIKDSTGQGDTYDRCFPWMIFYSFQCGTGLLSVEKPNTKIAEAREKKEKLALAKTQLKCVGEGGSEAPRKKKARKAKDIIALNSKKTTYVHPIRQANLKPLDETITSHLKGTAGNVAGGSRPPNSEKDVVDLRDSYRPSYLVPRVAHSFHYVHDEENYKDAATRRFVLDWGLRDDLRICPFWVCKELVSYLATPAEDEFLSSFSNIKVVREMQENDRLSKKVVLLESAHSGCSDRDRELMDWLKDMEKERDDWRQTASEQVERIKKLKEALEPKSKQLVDDEEKVQLLEVVKKLHMSVEYMKSLAVPIGLCLSAGWLGDLSLGKTQEQIAAMLFETSNLDIEGFITWKDKHCEIFTKQYPYVQKVVDSYRLPMDALMKISPDDPPPTANDGTKPSTKNNDDCTATKTPPEIQMTETITSAPPKTPT